MEQEAPGTFATDVVIQVGKTKKKAIFVLSLSGPPAFLSHYNIMQQKDCFFGH